MFVIGLMIMRILTGMLAFCDKVIADGDVERIRKQLKMTKIEKMFYDEKMEAVNNATERTAHDTAEYIETNLLRDGLSPEMISRNIGLDIAVVEELLRNLIREQSKEAMPV